MLNRSDSLTHSLKCNVLNTSEFILLPGAGSVFLNGNFVSKTRIEVTSRILHVNRLGLFQTFSHNALCSM